MPITMKKFRKGKFIEMEITTKDKKEDIIAKIKDLQKFPDVIGFYIGNKKILLESISDKNDIELLSRTLYWGRKPFFAKQITGREIERPEPVRIITDADYTIKFIKKYKPKFDEMLSKMAYTRDEVMHELPARTKLEQSIVSGLLKETIKKPHYDEVADITQDYYFIKEGVK